MTTGIAAMHVGVIGLGAVGAYVARRVLAAGHRCVVFDQSPRLVAELAAEMAHGAASVPDLVHELDPPRAIWLTGGPAGIDMQLMDLVAHLDAGDIVVDCSDSHYLDSIRRQRDLAAAWIHYVDVGLCDPPGGARQDLTLAIGGDAAVVRELHPVLRMLDAPASIRCGPAGAGHFVSMIHERVSRWQAALHAEAASANGATAGARDCDNAADADADDRLVASVAALTARLLADEDRADRTRLHALQPVPRRA